MDVPGRRDFSSMRISVSKNESAEWHFAAAMAWPMMESDLSE